MFYRFLAAYILYSLQYNYRLYEKWRAWELNIWNWCGYNCCHFVRGSDHRTRLTLLSLCLLLQPDQCCFTLALFPTSRNGRKLCRPQSSRTRARNLLFALLPRSKFENGTARSRIGIGKMNREKAPHPVRFLRFPNAIGTSCFMVLPQQSKYIGSFTGMLTPACVHVHSLKKSKCSACRRSNRLLFTWR